jgi:hypothetical protein
MLPSPSIIPAIYAFSSVTNFTSNFLFIVFSLYQKLILRFNPREAESLALIYGMCEDFKKVQFFLVA